MLDKDIRIKKLTEKVDKMLVDSTELLDWQKGLPFLERGNGSSSEKFLALAFTSTDHMPRLTWDSSFKIVAANSLFLDTLGYTLEDLQGKSLINPDGTSDFIVQQDIPASLEVVKHNMENAHSIWTEEITNKWLTKDGRTITIKWLKGFNNVLSGIGSAQCILGEVEE